MGKHRTPAQVVALLRSVEQDVAKGLTVSDSCRRHGVHTHAFYRWRRRRARSADEPELRIHELASEVERLKQLLAEVMLDNQMLREVAKKKW